MVQVILILIAEVNTNRSYPAPPGLVSEKWLDTTAASQKGHCVDEAIFSILNEKMVFSQAVLETENNMLESQAAQWPTKCEV